MTRLPMCESDNRISKLHEGQTNPQIFLFSVGFFESCIGNRNIIVHLTCGRVFRQLASIAAVVPDLISILSVTSLHLHSSYGCDHSKLKVTGLPASTNGRGAQVNARSDNP